MNSLNSLITLYEVWMTEDFKDNRKPHYPSFDVRHSLIGIASSVKKAEEIIEKKRSSCNRDAIYCFHVLQKFFDRLIEADECLSVYVYDKDGGLFSDRIFEPYNPERGTTGTTQGHMSDDIWFKKGDIVEVLQQDDRGCVRLGIIVDEHPSQDYIKMDSDAWRHDCYYDIVYPSTEAPSVDYWVSMFALLRPRFKIHPALEEKLKNVYSEHFTYPMRQKIAELSAELQIDAILEELGIQGKTSLPQRKETNVTIDLDLPSGPYHVDIPQDYVYNHIDRVRTTLFRLVGKPVSGRGYNIKLQKGHDKDLPF